MQLGASGKLNHKKVWLYVHRSMAASQVVATELQVLEICIFLHKRLSFFNSYIDVLVPCVGESLPCSSQMPKTRKQC